MYIPLFIHSHYSVLQGLNNPKEIIAAAKTHNMSAIAMTDINNISGCIEFYKEAKKEKIKPIIGSLIQTDEGTLLLIALNKEGYVDLLQIIAELNSKKHFKNTYYSFPLNTLSKFSLTNLIAITGHENSTLYNSIVYEFKIKETWQDLSDLNILKLQDLFKDNLYLELQFSEYDTFSKEVKEKIIIIANKYQLQLVATPRVYFLNKKDEELHQILISIQEKKPLYEINKINSPVYKYFNGYRFYLPTIEEFEKEINNKEAIENTNKIADRIENYELSKEPTLPKFKCPNKKNTEQYFRELCEVGWQKKIQPILQKSNEQIYKTRLEHELKVFKEANLFDYFLIIKDMLDYARSKNYLVGVGRGSSSGCLISYLLGITQIDPIPHNLLFERFFNAGRAKSLPDIDCDFESCSRDEIIEYIIKKYGKNNVSSIATYGTLMGRASLKAIFRAYNDLSFSEQNEITKAIPDKAKISDELQAMKLAGEESSVIRWTLLNKSKYLEQWCKIIDGKLEGPLADKFDKAIRLEGVLSTRSRHAAGVVVAPSNLKLLVPLIYDEKNKVQIIGCQMNDLEEIGLIKMDCLGLSTLDRLHDINNFEN